MSFIDKSTTRREFVKDVSLSAAAAAVVGSLNAWPAVAQGTKHGHLVRKISYNMKEQWKTMGPGNADLLWWPKGKELEGKNVNFSFGYYTKIGDWHTRETGGHVHPDGDELLIYVGFDPDRPEYLGAEIEHDAGTEYEHTFCLFVVLGIHGIAVLFLSPFREAGGQGPARRPQFAGFAVQNDHVSGTFQMDTHRGVSDQVAMSTCQRAPATIQLSIEPQTIDWGGVRATIRADRANPVLPGFGHAVVHMRPREQPFLVFGDAVARRYSWTAGSRF